jgi:hypothetical protein
MNDIEDGESYANVIYYKCSHIAGTSYISGERIKVEGLSQWRRHCFLERLRLFHQNEGWVKI